MAIAPQEQQNALLSVYDKTNIERFAAGLVDLGWAIHSSGGTAKRIEEAGIPVKDVSDLVGGEAILGHKVVTLSRQIHAGLLADPTNEEDMADLEREGIPLIDLVCVDMYPLETEIRNPEATPESIREKTDVGGPAMLHAAAKGRRIVLAHAYQRQLVLEWLRAGQPNGAQRRLAMAAVAEQAVADYASVSAYHLGLLSVES